MMSQGLSERFRRLPDAPGVYFFLKARMRADRRDADERRWPRKEDVLYIGRATSLRNRVRSYFSADVAHRRSTWIARMIKEATGVDFRKTDSVLEAILLEADLIKKIRPPYNTDLKDDKSFNCIVITKESYPAVLVARQTDIDFVKLTAKSHKLKAIYGPYPTGFHLQTALKLIRRIFPYRDANCAPPAKQVRPHKQHTNKLEFVSMCRPCFSRQIGFCPGVCTGEISRDEYAKTIRNLRLFFEGKKARLLKLLEREMKAAARKQEFERAGELKWQLFALRHIQDIALLKRNAADSRGFADADVRGYDSSPASIIGGIRERPRFRVEAYDLSHFGGKEIVGAMAVVEDGMARPSEYRLFKLRNIGGPHETTGLSEILRRRFNHPEWPFPRLIAVDGNIIQKRAAERVLTAAGQTIPVVAVVKNERHKPREILGFQEHAEILKNIRMSWREAERAILFANAEAHRFALKFQRSRRSLSPRNSPHPTKNGFVEAHYIAYSKQSDYCGG